MISDFLYRKPRILVLVLAVIAIAGAVAYRALPRLEDPVLSKRVGIITAVYPGADVVQAESQLALPLEEVLQDIAEIKEVRATCRTGIASLVVELSDSVNDVEPVWSRVRDRLADVEAFLPSGANKPNLKILELKAFAEIVALSWNRDSAPNLVLLRRLALELQNRIEALAGTEKVELFGDPGEEVLVELEPAVFAAMGTSTAAIAQQISASQSRQPAGYLHTADSDLLLDVTSGRDPLERIGQTQIQYGRGDTANLADVARITKGASRFPSSAARVDDQQAVVVAAFVRDQVRVDHWNKELRAVLDEFRAGLPAEILVQSIFSQHHYIDERLRQLHWNLLQSAGAVIIVILVLMGWRSTLVVTLALPLSALMVLAGMRMLGIPIHQMSVTGLIIALGLLIDNAIVIVDEVRSRIFAGLKPLRAIRQAVSHLAMPLFGSTLTTTLAFVPIATLPGPPGEFVGTIAISVILAINASLILAMTVVPAATALTLRSTGGHGWLSYGISSPSLSAVFGSSLDYFLRKPVIGIVLAMILPLLGFWLARSLPEQFFPPSDRRQIEIGLELPIQASLGETSARARSVYKAVAAHEAVQHCHWFIGGSAPTFYYNVVPRRRSTPYYGQALVDLQRGTDVPAFVRELQQELSEEFPDCRLIVRQLEQGPPFDAPIEIRVFGSDLAELASLGSQLRLTLSQVNSVIHTRSDLEETTQKLSVQVDERETLSAGLRTADIASQLYIGFEGASAGTIPDGPDELPIRVVGSAAEEGSLAQLADWSLLPLLRGPTSGPVGGQLPQSGPGQPVSSPEIPLSAMAKIELDSEVGSISRIDGRRVNEVKAYLVAGTLPSTAVTEFEARFAEAALTLPDGYSLSYGGESKERNQAVSNLMANAVVLFSIMVLTLVVSFGSFRIAAVIVMVAALSAGLGPGALWLFGFPFGFMAIVGTMGLVGVAINDAIVVMAGIRENSLARQGDLQEIKQVVMHRTRHVVATTLTTMAGFTPLILGGGEFWPPLAIAIAGGVGGATLLALYFVPCAYVLLAKRQ